jgi:hypothetical protein
MFFEQIHPVIAPGSVFDYLRCRVFEEKAKCSVQVCRLSIAVVVNGSKNQLTLVSGDSQLMLGMSMFDVVGAFAWALTTAPIPTYNQYGDPTYVYGAIGNNTTCKLQGFMIQLSFTSVFYNVALSIYYLLGKEM